MFESICNDEVSYPRWLDKDALNIIDKLLQRDPSDRLGSMEDKEPIKKHPFFIYDFDKLEKGEVEPPYKPNVGGVNDASNFDDDFTMEAVSYTHLTLPTICSV